MEHSAFENSVYVCEREKFIKEFEGELCRLICQTLFLATNIVIRIEAINKILHHPPGVFAGANITPPEYAI